MVSTDAAAEGGQARETRDGAGFAGGRFDTTGSVLAHIRSITASLLPAERAVAEALLRSPEAVIEMSSGQLAEMAGASRATVVRASQSLGFTGYQQLRVMLARDLGPASGLDGARTGERQTVPGEVRACFAAVSASVPAMTSLLDDKDLTRTVTLLTQSRRLLIVGNGFSAPVAALAAQRLAALGLATTSPADGISQQVAARHLHERDMLLAISGSGANEITLRCMVDARTAGARVVLVTAFGRSPLTSAADISLVTGMRDPTFRDELTVTTRIPQLILIEGLAAGVSYKLGAAGKKAHAATMAAVSVNLTE